MTTDRSSKAPLAGKALLIFDFDGTIADTSPLHCQAFCEVLRPYGVTVDYSHIAGLRTVDAIENLFELAGRPRPCAASLIALVEAKQRCVRQLMSERLVALPGALEFLDSARARFRLALVTSGSRGTISLGLSALGIHDWFGEIICADDVRHSKPHPEGFLRALELAGVNRDEAMVFEDSVAGFEAAKAAGIDFINIRERGWNEQLRFLE